MADLGLFVEFERTTLFSAPAASSSLAYCVLRMTRRPLYSSYISMYKAGGARPRLRAIDLHAERARATTCKFQSSVPLASRSHAFTHGEKAWTTAYARVVQLCTKLCNPIRLQIGETSRTHAYALPVGQCTVMCIHVWTQGEAGPQ